MHAIARRLFRIALEHSIVWVLVALCGVMSLLSDKFLTAANWANVLNNLAVPGIVAAGVALVVIAGGIDLSFVSILSCCAVLAAALEPIGFWLACVVPLLLGVALGAVNGVLVARVGANPLITTLGTQWLFLAALFICTEGQLVQGGSQGAFHAIANGKVLGVPLPIVLFLGLALVLWLAATRTVIGKYIYAHGSNRSGLRAAGVDDESVYLWTFVIAGFLTALAGVVLSSRLGGVRPTEGARYLLVVLTAVLLSGVSLKGGIGSIPHVVVATVVLGVIDNSMVLLEVPYEYQQMIKGVVFILAILYSNFTSKRLAAMRAG